MRGEGAQEQRLLFNPWSPLCGPQASDFLPNNSFISQGILHLPSFAVIDTQARYQQIQNTSDFCSRFHTLFSALIVVASKPVSLVGIGFLCGFS